MRFAAAIAGVVLLGACSAATPYGMINSAFLVASDKTMEDHVISLASGKNCSTVRVDTGRSYCEEDELNPSPAVFQPAPSRDGARVRAPPAVKAADRSCDGCRPASGGARCAGRAGRSR